MGNGGSITSKVELHPSLLCFTRFNDEDLRQAWHRARTSYADIYTLTKEDFEYIIDVNSVGHAIADEIFHVALRRAPSLSVDAMVPEIETTSSSDSNKLHKSGNKGVQGMST